MFVSRFEQHRAQDRQGNTGGADSSTTGDRQSGLRENGTGVERDRTDQAGQLR